MIIHRAGRRLSLATFLVAVLAIGASTPAAAAEGTYIQTNLVSDLPGMAPVVDPKLVNPWGLTRSATSPWWVSDNGVDFSTLYRGNGTKVALEVAVAGAPTGTVFNGTANFVVTQNNVSGPSRFIFATESGTILGWAPNVNPNTAILAETDPDAVYKGLAIGAVGTASYLYATNFRAGTVDVFDGQFHHATLSGDFSDPDIHAGFSPFGIAALAGNLYVTYAKRDATGHDDVAGPANGFVDVFDMSGHLLRRAATRGRLNSPWGVAIAPADFGRFSGDLLVGNFGDGRINAIDPVTGEFLDQLRDASNRPITIDGLWAIVFGGGPGSNSGPSNSLFFTAGINDESDGLFGTITAAS